MKRQQERITGGASGQNSRQLVLVLVVVTDVSGATTVSSYSGDETSEKVASGDGDTPRDSLSRARTME